MAEGAVDKPPITRRRIIERPRLTRLLDDSPARIKMLVAPAGYGKTTLARQWIQARTGAWVVANPSSVDVAALSSAVQGAAAELVPGAGDMLLERLAVTADADREAETLAEILASELSGWDPSHWIVVDDYHLIAGVSPPERFVESLLLRAPINVLILSRQRPSWATARRILYGEIYEVERGSLAMNPSEASMLLDMDEQASQQLVDVSGGWPAVLSLASLAPALKPFPAPTSLYRFFAEELYQRLEPEAQHALCRVALVNLSRRDQLVEFLGRDAEHVIDSGVMHGFLAETPPGRIELHPLLRSFLFDKLRAEPRELVLNAARHALEHLLRYNLWEEALDVADRFDSWRTPRRALSSVRSRASSSDRWLARS